MFVCFHGENIYKIKLNILKRIKVSTKSHSIHPLNEPIVLIFEWLKWHTVRKRRQNARDFKKWKQNNNRVNSEPAFKQWKKKKKCWCGSARCPAWKYSSLHSCKQSCPRARASAGAAFLSLKLIKRVSHDVRCPGRCKTIWLNSNGRLRLAWQWLLANSSGCTQGVKKVIFSSSDILRCTETRLHSDPFPPRRP